MTRSLVELHKAEKAGGLDRFGRLHRGSSLLEVGRLLQSAAGDRTRLWLLWRCVARHAVFVFSVRDPRIGLVFLAGADRDEALALPRKRLQGVGRHDPQAHPQEQENQPQAFQKKHPRSNLSFTGRDPFVGSKERLGGRGRRAEQEVSVNSSSAYRCNLGETLAPVM